MTSDGFHLIIFRMVSMIGYQSKLTVKKENWHHDQKPDAGNSQSQSDTTHNITLGIPFTPSCVCVYNIISCLCGFLANQTTNNKQPKPGVGIPTNIEEAFHCAVLAEDNQVTKTMHSWIYSS
jgi:hypothetical protein